MNLHNESLQLIFERVLRPTVQFCIEQPYPTPYLIVSWVDANVRMPIPWLRKYLGEGAPSEIPYKLIEESAFEAAKQLAKFIAASERPEK